VKIIYRSVCIYLTSREKNKTMFFRCIFVVWYCFTFEKEETWRKRKKICLVWRGRRNQTYVPEMICEISCWWFFLYLKWTHFYIQFPHAKWHFEVSIVTITCIYVILKFLFNKTHQSLYWENTTSFFFQPNILDRCKSSIYADRCLYTDVSMIL